LGVQFEASAQSDEVAPVQVKSAAGEAGVVSSTAQNRSTPGLGARARIKPSKPPDILAALELERTFPCRFTGALPPAFLESHFRSFIDGAIEGEPVSGGKPKKPAFFWYGRSIPENRGDV
jgi:hypothetical protein